MIIDDFEAIAKALKELQTEAKKNKLVPRRTEEPEDDEFADMHFIDALCDPYYAC
jgi:hypothetical protein